MNSLEHFFNEFMLRSPEERSEFIQSVSKLNINEPRILNLLEIIDIYDVKVSKKIKSNNIYFVCQMLAIYPNFIV